MNISFPCFHKCSFNALPLYLPPIIVQQGSSSLLYIFDILFGSITHLVYHRLVIFYFWRTIVFCTATCWIYTSIPINGSTHWLVSYWNLKFWYNRDWLHLRRVNTQIIVFQDTETPEEDGKNCTVNHVSNQEPSTRITPSIWVHDCRTNLHGS